eukprot:CAMPEP_0180658430 /NCGR_PEP_ID=MMETSP1037_2-20121125/56997_1 /TAXON_ID=632150 /ORGANISM="Azadinium spinosum, Strain 3D9" /LENGTH=44 /DNA_ID= /DNA_START= /DNA_END= /DNA_ORIENTATION=
MPPTNDRVVGAPDSRLVFTVLAAQSALDLAPKKALSLGQAQTTN